MTAMIFNLAPLSQCSKAKTRFSHRAQLMRADLPRVLVRRLSCPLHQLAHERGSSVAARVGLYRCWRSGKPLNHDIQQALDVQTYGIEAFIAASAAA